MVLPPILSRPLAAVGELRRLKIFLGTPALRATLSKVRHVRSDDSHGNGAVDPAESAEAESPEDLKSVRTDRYRSGKWHIDSWPAPQRQRLERR